jgi:hypothetical protein
MARTEDVAPQSRFQEAVLCNRDVFKLNDAVLHFVINLDASQPATAERYVTARYGAHFAQSMEPLYNRCAVANWRTARR